MAGGLNGYLDTITRAGLRTAAWSTLYWLQAMLGTPVETDLLRRLSPGSIKRRYLAYWIDGHLPTRLARVPLAVQGLFTLALHDRASDALRATVTLVGTIVDRRKECRLVLGSAETR